MDLKGLDLIARDDKNLKVSVPSFATVTRVEGGFVYVIIDGDEQELPSGLTKFGHVSCMAGDRVHIMRDNGVMYIDSSNRETVGGDFATKDYVDGKFSSLESELIEEPVDLNIFIEVGRKYNTRSNAVASSCLNTPTSASFSLEVLPATVSGGYLSHRVTDYKGNMFIRGLDNNVWGGWKQVATTDKIDILQCLTNGWQVGSNCDFSAMKIGGRIFIEGIVFNQSNPSNTRLAVNLPLPSDGIWHGGHMTGANNTSIYLVINPLGEIELQAGEHIPNVYYSVSIDYPA